MDDIKFKRKYFYHYFNVYEYIFFKLDQLFIALEKLLFYKYYIYYIWKKL